MQRIFSDHIRIKLEISNGKVFGNPQIAGN